MNKDAYTTLCIAQLALDGHSAATIQFFKGIAPGLLERGYVNGVIAATKTYMTPQGAGKHLHYLTRNGYLTRINHRRWELSDRFIKDRTLVSLTKYIYNN